MAQGFRRRIDLNAGWAEFDNGDQVRVGDRLVGRVIRVEFPGAEDQPSLSMTIDSTSLAPRCTDLHLSAGDGNEIRPVDIGKINLPYWVETIVALASDEITYVGPGTINSVIRVPDTSSGDQIAARKVIREARRAGRRRGGPALLARVAEVYLANPQRPAGAVEDAFAVAPRTAYRYIAQAREANLIPPRDQAKGAGHE